MKLQSQLTISLAFAAALLLASCDRGYRMEPSTMEHVGYHLWVDKYDDFELKASWINGLVGEWWIDPRLSISTNSKPVTIESVDLQTDQGSYPGTIGENTKIIPAHTTDAFLNISWKFEDKRPAPKVLGAASKIVLHLKIGEEQKVVEIGYKRARCCKY